MFAYHDNMWRIVNHVEAAEAAFRHKESGAREMTDRRADNIGGGGIMKISTRGVV